jgi:hypothetical protein
VAIDRTGWGFVNLLMVSLIWDHRVISLCRVRLDKLGSSHYDEQTALLSQALSILSAYTVVTLGDREFCSVDLARWPGEQGGYFCLRLKASTQIQIEDEEWQALSKLGLTPGHHVFFNQVSVTKTKGFGAARVAGKWKRRYRGFVPDEPWFILTNLESLDEAIAAYQKRFSIEEKYIARPEQGQRGKRRHSAFHIGLAAHRWVPFWESCQIQVQALMRLNRNKIDDYRRGLKAIDAILSTL